MESVWPQRIQVWIGSQNVLLGWCAQDSVREATLGPQGICVAPAHRVQVRNEL